MTDFFFFYPLVLLLIPIWLVAIISYHHHQQRKTDWDAFIDKPLQASIISGYKSPPKKIFSTRTWHSLLIALAGLLTLLALSGPSFQQLEVPLYEDQHSLIIGLDLSASMLAQDIEPNRLQRAKFIIIDLLKERKSGYTALVVFAGDAFPVTPLTRDIENIFTQLNFMSPEIMPAQGSRLDKAIDESAKLLSNAGYYKGDILLITDGLSNQSKAIKAVKKATHRGYSVSILGIGSEKGSSIPIDSSDSRNALLLEDKQGNIVISKLNSRILQSITDEGKGDYFQLTNQNSHLHQLLKHYKTNQHMQISDNQTLKYWINSGIWLIFPLIIMTLILFRKGVIWVVFFLVLAPADPLYASSLFNWDSLWLNHQQQIKKILEKPSNTMNDTEKSIDNTIKIRRPIDHSYTVENSQWDAAFAYRTEKYALAVQLYTRMDTADAWYNRGNALVKLHQLTEATQAYQVALQKQPSHKDAQFNLELIKKKSQGTSNNEQENQPSVKINSPTDLTHEQSTRENRTKRTQQNEQQAFDKQWLKSIPDDPSGLWRRKFLLQYKKHDPQQEAQQW